MIIAGKGDIECLKELIAAGADVIKQDEHGRTVLLAAAGNGHTECGEHLLKAGADMNITDKSGESVLVAAIRELTL